MVVAGAKTSCPVGVQLSEDPLLISAAVTETAPAPTAVDRFFVIFWQVALGSILSVTL